MELSVDKCMSLPVETISKITRAINTLNKEGYSFNFKTMVDVSSNDRIFVNEVFCSLCHATHLDIFHNIYRFTIDFSPDFTHDNNEAIKNFVKKFRYNRNTHTIYDIDEYGQILKLFASKGADIHSDDVFIYVCSQMMSPEIRDRVSDIAMEIGLKPREVVTEFYEDELVDAMLYYTRKYKLKQLWKTQN